MAKNNNENYEKTSEGQLTRHYNSLESHCIQNRMVLAQKWIGIRIQSPEIDSNIYGILICGKITFQSHDKGSCNNYKLKKTESYFISCTKLKNCRQI